MAAMQQIPFTCGEEVENDLRGCRRLAPEAGWVGSVLHPQVLSNGPDVNEVMKQREMDISGQLWPLALPR